MKEKLFIFVCTFALVFSLEYFMASDRDMRAMLFQSVGGALLAALTYKPLMRFVAYAIRKIVKPKPQ